MFKRVFIFCIPLSFCHADCPEKLNQSAIVGMTTPFALFMAYHLLPRHLDLPLIGKATPQKTHIATALLVASEAALLAKEYPSPTFTFMASFLSPIIGLGVALNLNRVLGNPVHPIKAVRAGRMFFVITDFALVPVYWWWQCQNGAKQS